MWLKTAENGSHSVRNRRASNTRGERPLEKFWISYFNEVAGPGRVSRVPRGSDPCINCLRIELGERVCANGKIWIFLIMVLICSNSKSFRIGGREPLSEIRLKGFDILCWKIVPRRPFHCGGWTFGQFYNPFLWESKPAGGLKNLPPTVPAHLLAIDEINFN